MNIECEHSHLGSDISTVKSQKLEFTFSCKFKSEMSMFKWLRYWMDSVLCWKFLVDYLVIKPSVIVWFRAEFVGFKQTGHCWFMMKSQNVSFHYLDVEGNICGLWSLYFMNGQFWKARIWSSMVRHTWLEVNKSLCGNCSMLVTSGCLS